MCTVLKVVLWITMILPTKAETRIEVTESTCGGDFDFDDVGILQLDYYGAFLGKGRVVNRLLTHNKKCVFNLQSTNNTGRQICISATTNSYYNSITCGIYFRYYLGSRDDSKIYTCEDMTSRSPLCTELGSVIAEIEYNDAVVNNKTFLQLKIYSRPYQETSSTTTVDWRAEWVSKAREEIWGKETKYDGKPFLEKRWWIFLILGIVFLLGAAFGVFKAFAERYIQAVRARENQNFTFTQQNVQHNPARQITSLPSEQHQPMFGRTVEEERGSYR